MLQIRLFGQLELRIGDQVLPLPGRRHGQLVFAYLALNPGLHSRISIASLFWPEVLDSSARASLRSAVASLRRSLGADASGYLNVERERLGLVDENVWVDVREFRRAVAEGRLSDALELSGEDLLQGLEHEWLVMAREELRTERAAVLSRLAAQAEDGGDLELAIAYTRDQVFLDPISETPSRQLMRRLALSGDRAAALGVYSGLVSRFRREFGGLPSAETRSLAQEIRRQADPLPSHERDLPLPLPGALARVKHPPFVGRDEPLREMLAMLERARSTKKQLVLISGEPGIGKTRLIIEFAARAHAAGSSLLHARCLQESVVPLQPLVGALCQYVQALTPARLRHELPDIAGELRALIPELSDPAVELPPPIVGDPEGEQARLVRAVVQTLEAASRCRPLVLVIDDLQWMDRPTARVVEHLLAGPVHFMIVMATRQPAPVWIEQLLRRARRREETSSFHLTGLDERAVSDLAQALGAPRADADAVGALRSRTEGNPLFIQALLAHGAHVPGTDATAGLARLPDLVTDVIGEEISALDHTARAVLASAAIAGEQFDYDLLQHAAGASQSETLDALDSAVRASVIREVQGTVGRYEFRHSLMREVILHELTATRRAHLHLRTAKALIEIGGGETPARPIAEQLIAAHDLAPRAMMSRYAAEAAAEAAAQRCYEDAARFYADAVAATPSDDEDQVRRRCQLLIELGHAQLRAGETKGVRELFAEAAQLAQESAEINLLAQAALGICALPFFPGDEAVDQFAVDLLHQALERLPEEEAAMRVRLLAQLAREQYFVEPSDVAERSITEAAALGRRSGDPLAQSEAISAAHLFASRAGRIADQLALAEELIDLGQRHREPQILIRGRTARAVTLLELGELAGMSTESAELERLAAELGQPAYGWWAALWRATRALLTEPLDEAAALADQALELGRAAFGEAAELAYQSQLFWRHWQLGSLAELSGALSELAARYQSMPAWRAITAIVELELGRPQAARQIVHQVMHVGLRPADDPALTAALLAEVCLRSGDSQPAARLYEMLLPYEARWAVTRWGSVSLCPIARPLGLLAATLGEHARASEYLNRAVDEAKHLGAERLAARAQTELESLPV